MVVERVGVWAGGGGGRGAGGQGKTALSLARQTGIKELVEALGQNPG